MIVRDVADVIEHCLQSIIPYVHDAIFVDTGSEDSTKDVIRALVPTAKIVDFNPTTHPQAFLRDVPETWPKDTPPAPYSGKWLLADFAGARQFGWAQAQTDFVMWVDSDDEVEKPEAIRSILDEMNRDRLDVALLNYDYSFDEQGRVTCALGRERIFRRSFGAYWTNPVHEVLVPMGLGRFYSAPNIVHRRHGKGSGGPPIAFRNLKILLDWHAKHGSGPNVDPRMLFYLAMEMRSLWPERAAKLFEKYVSVSGWDEERAMAHVMRGQIWENLGKLADAFTAFALAEAEFPVSPDGLYGLARVAYWKKDWPKVVEFTERAWASEKTERPRRSVLMANPVERATKPLVFLSAALVELKEWHRALEICNRGLALMPGDPHLLGNKEAAEKALAQANDPNAKTIGGINLKFKTDAPIDTPPVTIPVDVLVAFALEFWKRQEDATKALAFLDSLPAPVADAPRIKEARERTAGKVPQIAAPVRPVKVDFSHWTTPTDSVEVQSDARVETAKRSIVLLLGPGWEPWSPASINEGGIGGSETAAVYMARELAALGNDVTVVAEWDGLDGAVKYVHHARWDQAPCDVLIASRSAFPLAHLKAKFKVLWVHDIHVGPAEDPVIDAINQADVIFCLSQWHKTFFWEHYKHRVDPNKIAVTRNGIDLARFAAAPKKIGNRCIYASSWDRGLERLLEIFPAIRQHVPDAELHVFYGAKLWRDLSRNNPEMLRRVDTLEARVAEGVREGWLKNHGRVGQKQLAEAYAAAKVWSYPTWFTETFCIGALEAQAAGCVPVATSLAGLDETIKAGLLLKPPGTADITEKSYRDAFIAAVVRILRDDELRGKIADQVRQLALENGAWSKVAREWHTLFNTNLAKPHIEVEARKMRIAAIYGKFSSGLHGGFDVDKLFEARGLTGSESCFFNFVRGMAERGHKVDAFCETAEVRFGHPKVGGANVFPITTGITEEREYDAFVSWNEPDLLRGPAEHRRARALLVCPQQLNDFNYCQAGFDDVVDLYICPSETHRQHIHRNTGLDPAKLVVIPNSVNTELYEPLAGVRRDPKALIWTSSPDRGLHVALKIFERVRLQVPGASLKVFYRLQKWFEDVGHVPGENGDRAREVQALIDRLGRYGENGVYVFDGVPNVQLARALSGSRALLYPCEPIRFTEGFSVSIMDACAAGCEPIISDADALPEIYKDIAKVVPGTPSYKLEDWVTMVASKLVNPLDDKRIAELRAFAARYSRAAVAEQWEKALLPRLKR